MKSLIITKRSVSLGVAALGLWLAGAAPSHAATITQPGPQTGVPYASQVVMGDLDLAHLHGSVGAKSWAEPGFAPGAKGWTHTSNWIALDLSGLSDPTIFALELERGHGDTTQLFPAFSLYGGWDTNNLSVDHSFNNTGNISWSPHLTYLDHRANAGGPNGTASGTGVTSVFGSWVLAPGLYTLNFGGNPSFDLGQTGLHAFAATLTTSPVPVPAAVYLFGSGLIGLAGLARRRLSA